MKKWVVTTEVLAWVLGLSCCAILLVFHVQASAARKASFHLTSSYAPRERAQASGTEAGVRLASDEVSHSDQAIMGRLDIPAVGLSVPILAGYDPDSLRKGVGHIPGTALPGGLGNMALAGHRDTFFRPLRRIKLGDTLAVYTASGRYDYFVDSTTIVKPEEVSVIAIRDRPEMTLITCYPFQYVGSAPLRFIVHAHLESLEPVPLANSPANTPDAR